jgi:type IV pilus assembly protein PilM
MSESIWKKEIHLGRKKRKKQPKPVAEAPAAAPAQPASAPTKQSFWKKERHLFRRKKSAAPVPSPEARAAQVVSHYRVTAPPAHLPEFAPPEQAVEAPSPVEPSVPAPPEPTELPPPVHVAQPHAPLVPDVPVLLEPAEFGLPRPAAEPVAPVVEELTPYQFAAPVPVEPVPPVVEEPPRYEFVEPGAVEPVPPAVEEPVAYQFAAPAPVEPVPPGVEEPPAYEFADPVPVDSAPTDVPAVPFTTEEPAVPTWLVEPDPQVEDPVSGLEAPVASPEPRVLPVAEPETTQLPAAVVAAVVSEPAAELPEQVELPVEPPQAVEPPRAEKTKKKAGKGGDTKRVVGLRIGSTQLAAAHVANNGTAELMQLAQAPLERGLVIGGEVRDADGLARELKQFFAANKLPRKGIRLGIASNRIGVRLVDVPSVGDDKQFENAIRFRAQELLPIPITDAILDHVKLGETTSENGEPLTNVLLVFAHRELVGRYVDVCRAAGLRLDGIDLEAFALLRALAPPRAEGEEQSNAVVAVAVGHDRTVLAVSDGRICSLTRVLEWGSAQLDVTIARTLDLTPSQAEPIKLALSLTAPEPPEGLSNVQLEAVRSAVKTEIAVLGRELVSSLRFYQSRPDSLAIGEVLLSGGGSQLDGFAEELQILLGAPVRTADPFGRIEPAKKVVLPEHPGSLTIAVGLGIED